MVKKKKRRPSWDRKGNWWRERESERGESNGKLEKIYIYFF